MEGIREVWLGLNPVTGQEERKWCLRDQALAGRPTLRVLFTNGDWKEYAFDVEVMQPLLLYTTVPLILIAVWIMQFRITLPMRLRKRITDERSKLYWFTEPFLKHGSFDVNLIYIFLAINALVLFNAIRHNPRDGYDAPDHLAYIDTLAELRLPDKGDTDEYFSPPLAYVIPAVVKKVADPLICSREDERCSLAIQKSGQIQNVFLSIGLTFFIIKLVSFIQPHDPVRKRLALALLGILPVYYKTMGFIRGEPFVAFFSLWLIYLLVVLAFRHFASVRHTLAAGVVMGLLILSRQWGVLVIVGAMVWLGLVAIRWRSDTGRIVYVGVVMSVIAFIVGGWFYLSLQARFGSMLSFNREAGNTSIFDHPLEFYVGLGNGALFTRPYRDAFPDQILPVFYTELWGDYEGYFITYRYEVQPDYLLQYLGRVNAISLFPTALLLAGMGVGAIRFRKAIFSAHAEPSVMAYSLLFACIVSSLAGYMWFLIRYPSDQGDTIKASYMLQILPLIAVLGAEFLVTIRNRSYRLYVVILLIVGLILFHNLPAMMTRRTIW